ncbi:hypothetical protein HHL17_21030 [Chitinophaga sp. G-6-1-13]|uniref:Uncharacterized protein n=1 Tax=Chitinophaga fulva TaxID=2728842 RepID=A0A848GNZ9_9BACT|nr:hypothetical protein [Chitinophaga fulva]NML39697.1 hypothetical protein [Chitinophaga fulva]
MKKKNPLNPTLTLNKKTVGVLLQEPGTMMADNQLAAIKGGRLTTIGRTCNPWTFGEVCNVG